MRLNVSIKKGKNAGQKGSSEDRNVSTVNAVIENRSNFEVSRAPLKTIGNKIAKNSTYK